MFKPLSDLVGEFRLQLNQRSAAVRFFFFILCLFHLASDPGGIIQNFGVIVHQAVQRSLISVFHEAVLKHLMPLSYLTEFSGKQGAIRPCQAFCSGS